MGDFSLMYPVMEGLMGSFDVFQPHCFSGSYVSDGRLMGL